MSVKLPKSTQPRTRPKNDPKPEALNKEEGNLLGYKVFDASATLASYKSNMCCWALLLGLGPKSQTLKPQTLGLGLGFRLWVLGSQAQGFGG